MNNLSTLFLKIETTCMVSKEKLFFQTRKLCCPSFLHFLLQSRPTVGWCKTCFKQNIDSFQHVNAVHPCLRPDVRTAICLFLKMIRPCPGSVFLTSRGSFCQRAATTHPEWVTLLRTHGDVASHWLSIVLAGASFHSSAHAVFESGGLCIGTLQLSAVQRHLFFVSF